MALPGKPISDAIPRTRPSVYGTFGRAENSIAPALRRAAGARGRNQVLLLHVIFGFRSCTADLIVTFESEIRELPGHGGLRSSHLERLLDNRLYGEVRLDIGSRLWIGSSG
jgi:hypothetical protein